MKRVLVQSPAFIRAAKRFIRKRPDLLDSIHTTLTQLENDAFDPRLRTHKLKGDMAGCWASSAGYDLRVVFELITHDGSESVFLLSIGTHDEVY